MVRLVKVMFRYGDVMEEIAWAKMVLLPKGKGGYRVICIVEVLRKACSVVINCILKSSIVLHNPLHGFIEGRGEGTLTLEANLVQYLAGIAQNPPFQVFLDVRKTYGSLDREK